MSNHFKELADEAKIDVTWDETDPTRPIVSGSNEGMIALAILIVIECAKTAHLHTNTNGANNVE